MNSTTRLTASLAGLALLFAAALDDALAYERYRGSPGCDDCHSGFISRGPLHDLHQGNSQMTNSCDLCHDSTGDNPLTYTSGDAEGQELSRVPRDRQRDVVRVGSRTSASPCRRGRRHGFLRSHVRGLSRR